MYYGAILVSILLCISAGVAFPGPEHSDYPEREGTNENPLPYMEEDHTDDDREMESTYTEDSKSDEFEENIVTAEWHNRYRGVLDRQCPQGQAFYGVRSYFSKHRKDRLWEFRCREFDGLSNKCYTTTGLLNAYRKPLTFTCAPNALMTGVWSYHSKSRKRKDRVWKATCCYVSRGRRSVDYHWTGYVNSLRRSMDYYTWPGAALTGMSSYFRTKYGDRRWKFQHCRVQ